MAFYESRVFTTSLRVVQALLAILILGLTGYGEHHYIKRILDPNN